MAHPPVIGEGGGQPKISYEKPTTGGLPPVQPGPPPIESAVDATPDAAPATETATPQHPLINELAGRVGSTVIGGILHFDLHPGETKEATARAAGLSSVHELRRRFVTDLDLTYSARSRERREMSSLGVTGIARAVEAGFKDQQGSFAVTTTRADFRVKGDKRGKYVVAAILAPNASETEQGRTAGGTDVVVAAVRVQRLFGGITAKRKIKKALRSLNLRENKVGIADAVVEDTPISIVRNLGNESPANGPERLILGKDARGKKIVFQGVSGAKATARTETITPERMVRNPHLMKAESSIRRRVWAAGHALRMRPDKITHAIAGDPELGVAVLGPTAGASIARQPSQEQARQLVTERLEALEESLRGAPDGMDRRDRAMDLASIALYVHRDPKLHHLRGRLNDILANLGNRRPSWWHPLQRLAHTSMETRGALALGIQMKRLLHSQSLWERVVHSRSNDKYSFQRLVGHLTRTDTPSQGPYRVYGDSVRQGLARLTEDGAAVGLIGLGAGVAVGLTYLSPFLLGGAGVFGAYKLLTSKQAKSFYSGVGRVANAISNGLAATGAAIGRAGAAIRRKQKN